MLPASSWGFAWPIYTGLLNEAGTIHAVHTPPKVPPLMPGSPTVERNLNGILARAKRISTQEGAQEFVDIVSDVYQSLLDDMIRRL